MSLILYKQLMIALKKCNVEDEQIKIFILFYYSVQKWPSTPNIKNYVTLFQ